MLTKTESRILFLFLDNHEVKLATHDIHDMVLDNTSENRAFVYHAERWNDSAKDKFICIRKDGIHVQARILLDYLKSLLKVELDRL